MSFRTPILCRLKSFGGLRVRAIRQGRGMSSRFVQGRCSWLVIRNRRSTGSAGRMYRPNLVAKRVLAGRDQTAILEITANFRSQAPILEYVNQHFEEMLDESQAQPGFTALSSTRPAGDEPSVVAFEIVLDERHKNTSESLRQEEATVVADIVQRLIGAYPVWATSEKKFRPARASDIALLAPTGTSLWIYEQALEQCGIPVATQAGKGFFSPGSPGPDRHR